MKLAGNWLQVPATQRVCKLLTAAGFQALFVGGCVRNDLLQSAVTDIDIATDALPETVMELALSAGIRAIPTGIVHGTITVVVDNKGHEVTTFRRDVSTDGRRAVVAFSSTLQDDAQRRDFTINALYAKPDGTLVDPLDSLPDLRAHIIRFIGDPDQRIAEDFLRILRFFRFHAWFADPFLPIDQAGLAACQRNLPGMQTLSRERIGAEMRKLMAAPNPVAALQAMQGIGVLQIVLPGSDLACMAPLIDCEKSQNFAPRWQRRLAALMADDAESSLRLSRVETREQQAIRAALSQKETARQLAQRYGETAAIDATLIRSASDNTILPDGLQALAHSGAAAKFPVRAADLAGQISNGPEMGQALADLKEVWIASGMALSRAQLLSGFLTRT